MFSLNCRCERHVVNLFVRRSFFSFWVLLPLEDLQDPVGIRVPLGNGTLGRRVAPLSSQYAYP